MTGLKAAKNNELVKWIAYRLFRKHPELFQFVCAKNKIEHNIADYRCVERAATCFIDDS